jgi:hypothetical protein
MTYEYKDASGVRTIIEDEQLAEALRNELPGGHLVIWRTLEDEWNSDLTVRRIIRAEIPEFGPGEPITGEARGRSITSPDEDPAG